MAMAWLKLVNVVAVLSFVFCGSSSRIKAIPAEELDGALMILRAQGHGLFANAISTSDMLFDILSVPSLTLLAPTDPTVFALDMTNTPPFYISTLRLHALPLRLSWSQLRLLSNASLLPTLSPARQLRVLRRQQQQVNTLVVDGGDGAVEVVMPGLYYSSEVAVHALGGILTLRSKIPTSNNRTTTLFFPRNSSTNNTHLLPPPLPRIPIFNNTPNPTILPRCPLINHTNPTHSPAYPPSPLPTPSPATDRKKMGEVLASVGDMCATG